MEEGRIHDGDALHIDQIGEISLIVRDIEESCFPSLR